MINIQTIPAFSDNYIWLILLDDQHAAVVDPGDAHPVMAVLKRQGLKLSAMLITHHHHDHIDGIRTLQSHYPEALVYGPATPQIPQITQTVVDGDIITLGEGRGKIELIVLEVPGHTESHIAYYGKDALFCGDTLFTAGCGRLLGGSAQQLHESLNKIKKLPITTQVYCAHEYTLSNLLFARIAEPNNQQLLERQLFETARRQRGEATVPSALALELQTNPFLRCQEATIKANAEQFCGHPLPTEAEIFRVLRYWKDTLD